MSPIEYHWSVLRAELRKRAPEGHPGYSDAMIESLRNIFFAGSFAMLLIVSEMAETAKDDETFDKCVDALIKEASLGMGEPVPMDNPGIKLRRH